MSSRELLALIEEFPESSTFMQARDRGRRLVEHDDKLYLFGAQGRVPDDGLLIASYVDWTDERKLIGRAIQEIAAMRADGNGYQPDFTGLRDPLSQILMDREVKKRSEVVEAARKSIRDELYAYERR